MLPTTPSEPTLVFAIKQLQKQTCIETGKMAMKLKRAPSPQELRDNPEWMSAVIGIGEYLTMLARIRLREPS